MRESQEVRTTMRTLLQPQTQGWKGRNSQIWESLWFQYGILLPSSTAWSVSEPGAAMTRNEPSRLPSQGRTGMWAGGNWQGFRTGRNTIKLLILTSLGKIGLSRQFVWQIGAVSILISKNQIYQDPPLHNSRLAWTTRNRYGGIRKLSIDHMFFLIIIIEVTLVNKI